MADPVEHVDIPDAHRHEPKGVAAAAEGYVYTADGNGSGAWEELPAVKRASAFPVGTVLPYVGTSAPDGWALCNGQQLSRTIYSDLFFVMSTTYGVGNGSTTFHLPDLRGRVAAGRNAGSNRITTTGAGFNGDALGAVGGDDQVSLSTATIPSMSATSSAAGAHNHTTISPTAVVLRIASGPWKVESGGSIGINEISISSAGNHSHSLTFNPSSPNTPHSNIQPTIITTFIIYHGVAS